MIFIDHIYIYMKLRLAKETNQSQKKLDDYVTAIFSTYGQFGKIRKKDSGGRACKTFIWINSNLLSWEN